MLPIQQSLTPTQARSLLGLRVFVVEDEILISEEICFGLRSMGCEIVGPCYSVGMATAAAEAIDIDVGVLDMKLGNEMAFAVADILKSRNIPFLWASGHLYGNVDLEEPILHKPFSNVDLHRQMLRCLAGSNESENLKIPGSRQAQLAMSY